MSNFISRHTGDNWATPREVYDGLNAEFNFNCDPCPLDPTPSRDGLSMEWGTSTFVNPPYSKPRPWIEKAIEESKRGKTVVMLLRGDTSTAWWHDLVWGIAEIRFIRGRLRFNGRDPAPFPSILAIYRPGTEQAQEGQLKE